MSSQLEVGTILHKKYRIEGEIGKGGFGAIYKAVDLLLKRTVAVKTLLHAPAEVGSNISSATFNEYLERFRREAEVSSYFTGNPHIITVYGLEHDERDNFFLILEYLAKGSLAALIREQGQLPLTQACNIAIDICQALTDIHNHPADIVHRDLKPSNILLRVNGKAVVADFGIAQVGAESHRTMLADLRHPGSPPYKSPEQASSYDYLMPASDLYGVGLILYEMLTARVFAKFRRLPPSRDNTAVPPWLDKIIIKLLQDKVSDRFQQADEVIEALQKGLRTNNEAQTVLSQVVQAQESQEQLRLQLQKAEQAQAEQARLQKLEEERLAEQARLQKLQEDQENARLAEEERIKREADEAEKARLEAEAHIRRLEAAEREWRKREADEARWQAAEDSKKVQLEKEQEKARRKETEKAWQIADFTGEMSRAETRSDWDTAIQMGGLILEMDPNNKTARTRTTKAYVSRASASSRRGNNNQAIADCTKALELEPNLSLGYSERGKILFKLGEFEAAIDDYDNAIRLDPNKGSFYYQRGLCHSKVTDYHRAIADFSRAIQREPDNADYYFQRGLNLELRGASYFNKGDQDQASVDYERALQIDPTNPNYYYQRGLSFRRKGDPSRAFLDIDAAIQIEPNNAEYYFQRGILYTSTKHTDLAVADFTRAISLNATQAHYYYWRGLTHKQRKDKKLAKRDFEQASKLGSNKARLELNNL